MIQNEMIRISLYSSRFSLKGAAWSSELLIYFRYNNHIQDRKLVLEERKMDVMVTQWKDKSNNPFICFFKPCCALIWNFNLFLRGSESCQKSRAKNIGKFLSVLDVLGTKSENFQPSTNILEKIPCIFFVNIMWKTENNIPSIVFK